MAISRRYRKKNLHLSIKQRFYSWLPSWPEIVRKGSKSYEIKISEQVVSSAVLCCIKIPSINFPFNAVSLSRENRAKATAKLQLELCPLLLLFLFLFETTDNRYIIITMLPRRWVETHYSYYVTMLPALSRYHTLISLFLFLYILHILSFFLYT